MRLRDYIIIAISAIAMVLAAAILCITIQNHIDNDRELRDRLHYYKYINNYDIRSNEI